jgi:aspartyl-tRNA(Asn)/glutamyl-tRNA(Gln) amidotransferase subunit C
MKKIPKLFSNEEVEHIAWLARIELSEEEKKVFTSQLNTILDYFHIIDEVDTKETKPTLHILDLINVFREDVIEDSLPTDIALANAPMKDRGYFKAPKIL